MRQPAVFQQLAGPLTIHPREDVILRDIICTHREHTLAIYLHGKGFPPLIFLTPHGERAQADPALLGFHHQRPVSQGRQRPLG